MRVAYLCLDGGVPVFGSKGASVHVQEVIRALEAEGAQLELFTVRRGGERPSDLRVKVHELPRPEGDAANRERSALALNDTLRERLAAAGPFDLVYERYSLWSYGGLEYARERGIPALLEVNAPLVEEQRDHRELVHEAEARSAAVRAFGAATQLLPVSEEVSGYLRAAGVPGSKLEVVPNGVNTERFQPAPADPARPFTVGFVGTLKPWHGVGHLLDAFALLRLELPETQLAVVGDGPERSALESQAAALGLGDGVTFTGALPPEAVPAQLAAFDAAVAPYPKLEGFYFSPLKVYEYLAAGVPVVASRSGQLGSVLEDGKTGLLVAPGDPEELAGALLRLGRDPALRGALAAAGRARVLARHSWAGVARRILALALEPRGVMV